MIGLWALCKWSLTLWAVGFPHKMSGLSVHLPLGCSYFGSIFGFMMLLWLQFFAHRISFWDHVVWEFSMFDQSGHISYSRLFPKLRLAVISLGFVCISYWVCLWSTLMLGTLLLICTLSMLTQGCDVEPVMLHQVVLSFSAFPFGHSWVWLWSLLWMMCLRVIHVSKDVVTKDAPNL